MSATTGIEWTDATWNPVRGCSRVSEGCRHCYAELVAARFSGPGQPYEGLARRRSNGEPQWTGEVRVIEKHMTDPLRWQKPRRVFVNSMSDLFHEKITDADLDRIFAVMALSSRHTFQVLTKRPARMQEYVRGLYAPRGYDRLEAGARSVGYTLRFEGIPLVPAPLPNVWLGVSVENQDAANERIPLLVETSAEIRFLSCEPLLGPVEIDFDDIGSRDWEGRYLDWCIVGGESGPGARPCDLAWVRNLVAECAHAEVACFVKQLGSNPVDPWADTGALVNDRAPAVPHFHDRKGGDIDEWPRDLRVREFPGEVPA